jgi:hypothetical protein
VDRSSRQLYPQSTVLTISVENPSGFLFTFGALHHTICFTRNLARQRGAPATMERPLMIAWLCRVGNAEMKDEQGKDPRERLSPTARRVLDNLLHAQANDPAVRRVLPRSRREAARRIELAQAEINAMRDFMADQDA